MRTLSVLQYVKGAYTSYACPVCFMFRLGAFLCAVSSLPLLGGGGGWGGREQCTEVGWGGCPEVTGGCPALCVGGEGDVT